MRSSPSRWFTPQDLSNRETLAQYQVLNSVVLISLLGALGTVGATFAFDSQPASRAVMILLAGLLFVSFILLRMRILVPAQIMAPVSLFSSVTFIIALGSGLHDIATIAYAGILIVASLTLGRNGVYGFSALTILAVFGFWWFESTGRLVTDASGLTTPDDPFLISIFVLAITFTIIVLLNRYNTSLRLAHENEAVQIETNRELLQLKTNLEARVEERTTELGRRASQLEAISKVARAISAVQDLEHLLPNVASVVSEQFGFYHTGIFLLDERLEFAVLRAVNSEGGQRMLKRGHRLRLGATSIVGYAATTGEARIALDVGMDSVYFNNPDLPNTRSEMALPLKSGNNVIGVLDVQSTETNAFLPEDINVLTTLANQIAIAIENSQLFSQTRKALAESQSVYNEYIKREWSQFGRKFGQIGFVYDGIRTQAIPNALPETDQANTRIPIKIRGVTVGYVTLRSNDPSRIWSQDEINLVQAAAERTGLAIENIRLLDEAQRRAAKERTIGEISSRIAASIDMRDIMQTAVQELGKAMPGSEITLQFEEKG